MRPCWKCCSRGRLPLWCMRGPAAAVAETVRRADMVKACGGASHRRAAFISDALNRWQT